MKKFTRILVCLMLFVLTFSLVACGGKKDKDTFVYPTSSMATQGNGGMSVQKGDYLYFVNGFKSITSTDITKKTKYNLGSLVVTKLDKDGNPVTDKGGIKDDHCRVMSDMLAGYEVTDLHLLGEYLYFASPCLENEMVSGKEVWAKDKVVFYRVKLNKPGKVEKLYQTEVNYTDFDYTYYTDESSVFILIHETETDRLVRVECGKGVTIVASNITSIVMPKNENAGENVFYTQDSSLVRYDVVNNIKSNYLSVDANAEVKFVAGGYVYITENSTDLLVSKIENKSEFVYISNTEVQVSKDGKIGVDLDSNKKMIEYYQPSESGYAEYKELASEENEITIIGFNDSDLFYYITKDDSIIIKMVSVTNVLAGTPTDPVEVATLTNIDKTHFDIENSYIYFYQQVGNRDNLYLHRICVNNPEASQEAQMIGIYLNEDLI